MVELAGDQGMPVSPPRLPAIVRLVWDGEPYAWYVRGHVEDEPALATVREEILERLAEDDREDEEPPELTVVQRSHARWQWPEAGLEVPGNGYTLTQSAPGPGAFKITVVRRLADVERDRAYRQERLEWPARSLAAFAELFPEATGARWHVHGDGTAQDLGEVRARFPGLTHEVAWRQDQPKFLYPLPVEADLLRAWLAGRRRAMAALGQEKTP